MLVKVGEHKMSCKEYHKTNKQKQNLTCLSVVKSIKNNKQGTICSTVCQFIWINIYIFSAYLKPRYYIYYDIISILICFSCLFI